MTELAIREDRALELAPADRADAAIARLSAWAEAASATHRMAETLVQTSFVPQAFRGKPIEATAAMLAGAEVGLSPMAALRSFDVIQGTAAPRANTLRAIVQSMGHEIRLVEATETRAIVEGRRRGEANWQRSEWTIERAKRLKLTGKDNWQNQPQAMLVARATAECARLVASDAILGIGYSSEELFDQLSAGEVTAEVKPPTRTRRRTPLAEQPEPELPDEAPAVEMISPEQQSMMFGQFKTVGITDKDAMLAFIQQQIGRRIESRTDMTKAEATRVIDALLNLGESEEPSFDDEPADVPTSPDGVTQ